MFKPDQCMPSRSHGAALGYGPASYVEALGSLLLLQAKSPAQA
ncbi:hypothetical protein [Actinacidiphila acididurans]|nr:hypothetical protein [Actinacidiphila acididurans]